MFGIVGCIVGLLVVKEVAAYRLSASHPLNVRLNPPRKGASGDKSGGSSHNDGNFSGSDWSSGCDGTD